MKIRCCETSSENNTSFKGIYTNKVLKRGLMFASDNGSLFAAGTSLALSTFVRPAVTLATPNTDDKNKRLACTKSIASSLVGYLMLLGISTPVANAVKQIDTNPNKFLKLSTINALKSTEENCVSKSKKYMLATQIFKLGLSFVTAIPKSFLVCALIPPIMTKLFNTNSNNAIVSNNIQQKNIKDKKVSFKGNFLAQKIGKIIDTNFIKDFANKYSESNIAMHIMAVTDTVSTLAFIGQVENNKKIDKNSKTNLAYNSIISTGLSIAGGYTLDSALEKPTQKFITKFKQANKNDKNLHKYLEGIKIAKPVLILGGIYYGIIPLISTFLADKASKNKF